MEVLEFFFYLDYAISCFCRRCSMISDVMAELLLPYLFIMILYMQADYMWRGEKYEYKIFKKMVNA